MERVLYAYIRKGTYPNIFFTEAGYIRVAKTPTTPLHSSCSISVPRHGFRPAWAPLTLPYPARQRYSQTDSKLN